MTQIPDGDWTCMGCGAGIQTSNRVLFNILVTRHMTDCEEYAQYEKRSRNDPNRPGL